MNIHLGMNQINADINIAKYHKMIGNFQIKIKQMKKLKKN